MPDDFSPIRLVNATGDTMAELTPHGVRWVATSLPAELTITPEDRAVWLGLQLENARLQHEVERLEAELAQERARADRNETYGRDLKHEAGKLRAELKRCRADAGAIRANAGNPDLL